MGSNPYPADILEADGSVRIGGAVNFTDPDNQPGGGSQPGVAIVRKFPFAFNTAGLAAGHAVYTPTAGDVLLDLFVTIETAWDGTTPQADVQTSDVLTTSGVFSNITNSVLDMTKADSPGIMGASGGQMGSALTATAIAMGAANVGDGLYAVSGADVNLISGAVAGGNRPLPCVLAAVPILIWVTQDGLKGGTAPGAAQGAATLYLVTATPA
jgi:hypothetical protein